MGHFFKILKSREIYGHFISSCHSQRRPATSPSQRLFSKISEWHCYSLSKLLNNRTFSNHVFLGFTKDGNFIMSYSQQWDFYSNDYMPSKVYRLHWWKITTNESDFQKRLIPVADVPLFGLQEISYQLHIAVCQWPRDYSRVIVYGSSNVSSDEPSLSYVTLTAVPSVSNCAQCDVQCNNAIARAPNADQSQGSVNPRCFFHHFTIHTRFEVTVPRPPFLPKLFLRLHNCVILHTGDTIIALAVSFPKSPESEERNRLSGVIDSSNFIGSGRDWQPANIAGTHNQLNHRPSLTTESSADNFFAIPSFNEVVKLPADHDLDELTSPLKQYQSDCFESIEEPLTLHCSQKSNSAFDFACSTSCSSSLAPPYLPFGQTTSGVTLSIRTYSYQAEEADSREEDGILDEDDYHKLLSLDVHGAGYRLMTQCSSEELASQHWITVRQLSLDIEHCISDSIRSNSDWATRYISLLDYDAQILEVCPDTFCIAAIVFIVVRAHPASSSSSKKIPSSYHSKVALTWNLITGKCKTFEVTGLEPTDGSHNWRSGLRTCLNLLQSFQVPSTYQNAVKVMTNSTVFSGKSLPTLYDPVFHTALFL